MTTPSGEQMTLPLGVRECRCCHEMREYPDGYHRTTNTLDGRRGTCKVCVYKQREAYDPEIRKAGQARYRGKERSREVKRRYNAQYMQRPEVRSATYARQKAYRERNMEQFREYTRNRRARFSVGKGSLTDVTREQIQARWNYFGGRCWLCGCEAECMDHVKPVARGGLNMASNLRPACHACNRRKSAAWPLDTSLRPAINLDVARHALAQVNAGEFDERRFRITLRRLAA